ncbi:MAG: hypothetical protein NTV10_05275 [Methanoregula sp.]|nr:hypothetical protein [Methanoregula sp.]
MDIVMDAVSKLKKVLHFSGCEEGPVVLQVNPDIVPCRFEKGACMEACFGGRTAEFMTFDPIHATTKLEFMFGVPLDTPVTRGAACAILNVATAFLCMSRNLRACPPACHDPCRQDLAKRLGGGRVFCAGAIPPVELGSGRYVAEDPESADIIVINGEGSIEPGTGDLIQKYGDSKKILLLGPSTAGIANLEKIERFCPYGT